MTKEDIAAIEARARAAYEEIKHSWEVSEWSEYSLTDANDLINGVDALLAEVERLRAVEKEFDEYLEHDYPERIERKCDEIKRLRDWVSDLQSGMYVNCVYCGHRYGPEGKVPASMADVLKRHIEQCPDHPMSKLKAENETLRRERDAAVEDVRRCASTCKHGKGCMYISAVTGRPDCMGCDDFEWRGVKGE